MSRPAIETLEPGDGTVVRVVYSLRGCPGPCNRTVQEALARSSGWHAVLQIARGLTRAAPPASARAARSSTSEHASDRRPPPPGSESRCSIGSLAVLLVRLLGHQVERALLSAGRTNLRGSAERGSPAREVRVVQGLAVEELAYREKL